MTRVRSIEGQTVRFIRTMMLLSAGLLAVGCFSSRATRPAGAGSAAAGAGGNAKSTSQPTNNIRPTPFWAKEEQDRRPAPLSVPGANVSSGDDRGGPKSAGNETADYNGVLAGSLVDSYNRHVPRAYVQVVASDGGATGRPIEMAVENGYFVIPGLTPGRAYMLTARTIDGDRKLAGRVQAIPPNARVVIRVSEDIYSNTVPTPPPTIDPGVGGGPRMGRPVPDPSAPASRAEGLRGDGDGWRNEGATPAAGDGPPPPPFDAPSGDPDRLPPFNQENIADREKDKGPRRDGPPVINVPGGPGAPPLPDPEPPPMGGRAPASGAGAFRSPVSARIPLCEFAGPNRLTNFALHDVYGQPWEFKQAQGRLILVDFWATWCGPCVKSIPHLKKLHTDFGPYGLEVIGIACEGVPASEGSRQALETIEKRQINYRVLICDGKNNDCPVQQKFQVRALPTLVLLDKSGQILWRGDSAGFAQLDQILRRQLTGGR